MQLELVGRIQRRPTGIVADHLYFEMRGGEILASKVILADVTCDRREQRAFTSIQATHSQ